MEKKNWDKKLVKTFDFGKRKEKKRKEKGKGFLIVHLFIEIDLNYFKNQTVSKFIRDTTVLSKRTNKKAISEFFPQRFRTFKGYNRRVTTKYDRRMDIRKK